MVRFHLTHVYHSCNYLHSSGVHKCDPFDQTLSCGCKKGLGHKTTKEVMPWLSQLGCVCWHNNISHTYKLALSLVQINGSVQYYTILRFISIRPYQFNFLQKKAGNRPGWSTWNKNKPIKRRCGSVDSEHHHTINDQQFCLVMNTRTNYCSIAALMSI